MALRFKDLSLGESLAVTSTTSSVIPPPKITEATRPMIFAARPDSKEPISFEEPMKIEFTEATLPLISSGVTSCIVVALITTLMLSNIPLIISSAKER